MERRNVAIGSGRVLACREFGPATGAPLVYCHGGFLSGLEIEPWSDALVAANVRVIAPARPGIDGSSPAPGRTTADWADDVRALLDALDVPKAGVFGWSMGGQYALVCAALLPDRIQRAAVVAGAIPFSDDRTFRELSKLDQRLTRLSQRHKFAARITFGAMALSAKHAPGSWTKTLCKDLPDSEAAVVRSLSDPGLAKAAAAGLASTRGMVEEYLAWARPWGFDIADITVPTTIWQGTLDTLIPASWGDYLAQRIPNARLCRCEGEGHLLAYSHQTEMLHDLTAPV